MSNIKFSPISKSQKDLKLANLHFKEGRYGPASKIYKELELQSDFYKNLLSANIYLCEKRILEKSSNILNELKNEIFSLDTYEKKFVGQEKDFIVNKRIEIQDENGVKGWFCVAKQFANQRFKIQVEYNLDVISCTEVYPRKDVERKLSHPSFGFLNDIPTSFMDGESYRFSIRIFCDELKILSKVWEIDYKFKSAWARDLHVTNKPVLLLGSHNFKIQGAQTSLMQLAMGLKSKYDIYVCSPSNGPMADAYHKIGIKTLIHSGLKLEENAGGDQWRNSIRSLVESVKILNPEKIIANTLQSVNLAIAGKIANKKVILIPRESEDPDTYFDTIDSSVNKFLGVIERIVDSMVFVAEATKNLWVHRGLKNSRVIRNGLYEPLLISKSVNSSKSDLRVKYNYKNSEIIFLSVGTVCERKGQMDALLAFEKIIKNARVDARLVIIGMNSNDYSNLLIRKFKEMSADVQLRVNFINETSNDADPIVVEHYKMADVFVMNSIHESYPRVILEALFFGLPVISTKCFGVVEQIVDGYSGLFYRSNNIDQLYEHMIDISVLDNLKYYKSNASNQYGRLTNYKEMVDLYMLELESI